MNSHDKVYQNVASSLKYDLEDLISSYEDNLAVKMASEVRGYDPEYALEDMFGSEAKKYDKLRENAILDLVEAMLAVLFGNNNM